MAGADRGSYVEALRRAPSGGAHTATWRRQRFAARIVLAMISFGASFGVAAADQTADQLPIFDAHVHYSHDAWSVVPTADVIGLMRKAGLKHALVSSSDDEGTRRLYDAAPDLVVPSLRPYRRRGEISTWMRDDSVVAHLEQRLRQYRYAAIGEFHLYGSDADLPVPRRVVRLARQHRLILHAHSDADAVERLFRQDPDARILWAHAGFDRPEAVRAMLRRYPTLHADLAFRSDMGSDGRVDPAWAEAFREFPERFMVGTDTFAPERLHYIPEHADYSRGWLRALPRDLAERIAWRNAEAFIVPVWEASRTRAQAPGEAPAAPAPVAAATGTTDPGGERACRAATDAPGARRLDGTHVSVVYRTEPAQLRVGEHFSVLATVCARAADADVEAFAVDAQMPEHRHGMNYAPRVTRRGAQRFDADGLMFHMPGRWRIEFELRTAAGSDRLAQDLELR